MAALVLARITVVAVTVFLYRHQAYQCNVSMVLKDWKTGRELKSNKVNDLGKQISGKAEKTYGDAREVVKDTNKYS